MARIGQFFRSGRAGWTALAVLLGTALPSARADLITATDSTGSKVSVLVDFFQGVNAAPLVLSNNGGTVSLSLPNTGANNYGLLFGVKVGNDSLDPTQILGTANPPDPATGQFTYTPTIDGKTYTLAGTLRTSSPIDFNTVIPGLQGFAQVGLFAFSAVGDASLTFSVTDPHGHVVDFADTERTPEPASLVLAGLGLVGAAGYGWRRRRRTA